VDSYDVFLVQGRGRRRWRIDPHAGPEFRPGLDLRILKRFHPTEEWVLGPGDMLYLPPGVGHEGTALGDCLTYSIGFLAPTAAELGARALQRVVMTLGETRFGDPGRRRSAHPGEIGKADVARFAALLRAEMGDVRFADLPAVLGEHLSERRGDGPPARSTSAASVTRVLRAGGRLRRTPGARLVYVREREGAALLFAHGFGRRLSPALAFAAPLLADRRVPDPARVLEGLRRSGFPALVAELVSEGVFDLRR
jgi:50S ribosomal protein L16 3-hydroxylase